MNARIKSLTVNTEKDFCFLKGVNGVQILSQLHQAGQQSSLLPN